MKIEPEEVPLKIILFTSCSFGKIEAIILSIGTIVHQETLTIFLHIDCNGRNLAGQYPAW
jgi:hypothetical protein